MTEVKSSKITAYSTRLGDAVNIAVLANAFVYFGAIVAQHHGQIDIFQKSFMTDGFCVSNKD